MSSASVASKKYQLFIDGQWVDAESGKTFKTPNPATGETLAEVAEADKADIDKAVNAARRAFEGKWSKMSARDRGRLLVELEKTVAIFEPRLQEVRVSLVDSPGQNSRVVHFQIEGMLQMDPSPEQVSFDTTLQLSSGEYQIRGERSA